MNKLISVILALVLCALGCAFAEASDVTGEWYLNVIESEGMQLDPALLGMELTLTLNADGTAEMKSFEVADAGTTWRMEGNNVIITDALGDSLTACPENGNLEIDDVQSGIVMIFGRQKEALESYVPAAVVSAPVMQDFEGNWNAVFVDMMGMQLSVDAMDMKLMLDIGGDSAIVIHNDGEEDVVYTAPLHLDGDVLIIEAVEDQMPINLQLLQDGKLVYSEDTEGLVMNIYFEKIV